MQLPSVVTTVPDPSSRVIYKIVAYRRVSQAEALFAIRMYLSKRKRPKPNTEIVITTVIGAHE